MKLAVLKERSENESRVAATPDTVKRLTALGVEVVVETGAGDDASIPDTEFAAAGAQIAQDFRAALDGADLVYKVRRPIAEELSAIKPGAGLVGLLAPYAARDALQAYAEKGLHAIAMELIPRITRAQAMDALSSQANLAGYRAVVEAAHLYGRGFP